MDKKAYSRVYNQSKQELRDAIKRFERQNPERFAELQAQAQYELEHPPERPIIRHSLPSRLCPHFDADEFVRLHHTQSFYIHTKDCFNITHLYFESLDNETAKEVLVRRHPKFIERSEEVVRVDKCKCPLC